MTVLRLLSKYSSDLPKDELTTNVGLIQNGLGLYQAWTGIAAALNLGFALRLIHKVPLGTVCWIVLTSLACAYILYVIADHVIMGFRFRYQISPYVVFVWGYLGIVSRAHASDEQYMKLVYASLALSVLGLIGKIARSFVMVNVQPTILENNS